MRLAMIGLGKMGGNMVRRLRRGGIEVVGYDRDAQVVAGLAGECGMLAAASVADAVGKLPSPKVVWLMLPSGDPTENQLKELVPMLARGDIVVDGGNSNYKESQRRGAWLAEQGIGFMDSGTSGGVWGLENGYCLMVGATPEVAKVVEPVLKVLAPAPDRGWAHVGPVGAGHYSKMIHNGIEYGMMQALAEGLDLLKGKQEFNYDLAQLTELWRHSSVVRSWLLDLTADALKSDQELANIAPYVSDSGEGRWTVIDSIEQGIPAPVLTLALQMRFASQDEKGYSYRLLSLMRNAFRGQYGSGTIGGQTVPGYTEEKGVAPDSTTETYAALKLFVDNWRWSGVPFYLRTGKRMAEGSSAICIRFKNPPQDLLRHTRHEPARPNWIMLGIQPNDCMKMELQVKVPGLELSTRTLSLDATYRKATDQEYDAYEGLLLDTLLGDRATTRWSGRGGSSTRC